METVDVPVSVASVPIPVAEAVPHSQQEQKRPPSSASVTSSSTGGEWEFPLTDDVKTLLDQGKTVVTNALGPEGTRAVQEVRQMAQRFITQHITRVLDGSSSEGKEGRSSLERDLAHHTQTLQKWLGSGLDDDHNLGEEGEEMNLFDVHADEVKEVLIETISRMMLDSQVGELFIQTLVDSPEANVGRVLDAQRLKNAHERNACYRSCPSFVPKRTVAREVAEEEMIRMLQSVAEGIQSSEFSQAISRLVRAELDQSDSGRTLRRMASRMKQNGMGRLLLNIISRQVIQSKAGQALTWALIMQEISKSQMLRDSNVALTMSREGARSSMKLATAAVVDNLVEYTTIGSPTIAAYLSWIRMLLVAALMIIILSDVSAIIVAVNYWHAPCAEPLQWYWMIVGWVGVLSFASHPCMRLLYWTYGARAGEMFNQISVADLGSGLAYLLAVKSDWFTRLGIVVAFLMRGVYVLGSVWVYGMSASTISREPACDYTLFFYSWWFLTVVWALHSLAFFMLVGVACWSYRAHKRLQDGYLPGQ